MLFPSPLVEGRLVQRYKRFLADVELGDGSLVTAHCANPGAMLGLAAPGARVFLAPARNPKAKFAWSWQLVEADFGGGPELVGIDTSHPNRIVEAAVAAGWFHEFAGWNRLRREVAYGERSRVDLLLAGDGRPPCFVEIKNVHMMRRPGVAEFPDCRTARGARHLDELAAQVRAGGRAVMVYLIQMRAEAFDLARDIDPAYAAGFAAARAAGVEAIAAPCRVGLEGIEIDRRVLAVEKAPFRWSKTLGELLAARGYAQALETAANYVFERQRG